jgi:site-specific DNA-methyltransferase (adenine-specific)
MSNILDIDVFKKNTQDKVLNIANIDGSFLFNGDCVDVLPHIPDNSVDLVVTSPPYNKGYWSVNRRPNNPQYFQTKSRRITYGEFDDDMEPEDYEKQQRFILDNLCRIIKPTGSIFYNHIDILKEHTTIHPKYVYDYPLKQIIIWNRKNTPKIDKSYFYPINEYIFWIKKDNNSIPKFNRKSSIFQKNIWDIPPDYKNDFPAPYPIELVNNCILATTNEGDVVLDCFNGSGTTCLGAQGLNRKFIGIERETKYFNLAKERIEEKINNSKRGLF